MTAPVPGAFTYDLRENHNFGVTTYLDYVTYDHILHRVRLRMTDPPFALGSEVKLSITSANRDV